jgi:hypothetical protein
MKRIALFTLLMATAIFGQPKTLILADTSRSEATRANSNRAEQQRVLAALPDTTWCELYTVGAQVKRRFQGVLDPAHRAEVQRLIQAEQFSEPNTALGEAIQEALAAVAGSSGPNRIVLFTDGQARSAPGSPYRWRSFDSILSGVRLPPGTELLISITGGAPPRANVAGVHVITAPPVDWAALLSIPKPPPKPERPPAHSKRWIMGALLVTGVSAVFGLLAWRHLRSGSRLQDLTASAVEEARPCDTAENPLPQQTYTIELDDKTVSLADGEALMAGDSPLADWYLPGAAAVVQFQHRNGTAWLENTGESPVQVGRVPVAPRRRLRLPKQPVEIAIGRFTALCFPELTAAREVVR